MPPRHALVPVLVLAAACASQPVRPVPDPLPEVLEWAAARARSATFLGLKTRENTSDTLDELAFEPGVRVRSVVEGSPAAAAGFRPGDVVLALGGHPTDDPETLARLVEARVSADEVEVRVQRGDAVFDVPVVLADGGAEPVATELLCHKDPARSRAGWKGGRGGVVLVASDAEAPFPRAGVAVGSVVLAVEGEPVLSAHALIRRLAQQSPGARVRVEYVDPEGAKHTVRVKLHDEPTRVTRFSVPVVAGYHRDLERDRVSLVLGDLWLVSLFRYEREGAEKRWSFLRFFRFHSGVGKLTE